MTHSTTVYVAASQAGHQVEPPVRSHPPGGPRRERPAALPESPHPHDGSADDEHDEDGGDEVAHDDPPLAEQLARVDVLDGDVVAGCHVEHGTGRPVEHDLGVAAVVETHLGGGGPRPEHDPVDVTGTVGALEVAIDGDGAYPGAIRRLVGHCEQLS